MPDSDGNTFEHDLVFTPGDTGGFQNVHVEMEIKKDELLLLLTADELIDKQDMQKILRALQEDKLNRMRVRLVKECIVMLYAGGQKYRVVVEGEDAQVKELIPMEG